MKCRTQIYDRMRSLSLYDFSKKKEKSLVECEIESYLKVLEVIEQEIHSVMEGVFAALCGEERLMEYERMLGIPINKTIPLEKRRKILESKMGLDPSDFGKKGLERSLQALGIQATVTEKPSEGKILVEPEAMADSAMTLDQAKEAFRELMPAHLNAEFLTGGLTFAQFDALNKTWADLDSMNKSWAELEVMKESQWKKGV